MRLVVDANILFAALIKDGTTAQLMISDKLHLFAPEFLFEEFLKYEEVIVKKTHRTNDDFQHYLKLLKEVITVIPKSQINPFLNDAQKISPDPNDSPYFALALALNAHIWSNDKQLKEFQGTILVYSTSDLIKLVPLLKK